MGFKSILNVVVLDRFPFVNSITLVKGDDEWTFFLSEKLNRLEGLLLKTMHQIDDEDSDITQR